ncbi:riboflavin synthase subunit beta [Aureicoccus marinus]|jgi:hypothetical protein|uniref:Riboflavin synthase subunit beta n=1 Tax=Aureicoccus marinus TaxID=754435 RepID=A0A2S7T5E2_9FLAO|nr:riboflavin synthase subunit beta [Aureicoccus marinus]PQJ14705.1 riboflavin synthase subunit beta [Aureicoccus marinus]
MRNLFRLKRNKSFTYKPRYYQGEENPFKIEHKLDQFRSTAQHQRGIKNKVLNALADWQTEGDRDMRIRIAIILGVLILLFLFIIDFDLSIFLDNE